MGRWLLVLLAALALPAQAGVFDDEEARARIEKLRADFDAVSRRVEQASKNQLDFVNQAEAVKADLARLRGQVEVLVNEVEGTQKRQRDFYIDLDSRLRKLETAAAQAAAAQTAPAVAEAKPDVAAKPDPAQEGRDYEAALGMFKAGRYKEALAAFQGFIKTYASSGLLPNAYYWSASSHYQMREYARAAETFAKVAAAWPNDQKAPDALLAQGNALNEAGDAKGAQKAFESLIARYPASTAAQTAKLRLKKR